MKHTYGGAWTRTKLTILGAYLSAYTTALKNTPFNLHYADAFAGTGVQSPKSSERQSELLPLEDLKGSVLTALESKPGFHRYHFNDLSSDHVTALRKIMALHADKKITVSQADANDFVSRFCQSLGSMDRAILFVDPYNTELDWSTIETVAKTKKVDLWLLFPLSALLRMTPKDGAKIKPEWEGTINRLLGTDGWKTALYSPVDEPRMPDLFEEPREETATERVNPKELQRWVKTRLEDAFPFVAEPVMLKNNNRPLFSFFFAVSNDDPRAWGLARKIASSIIQKHQ